MDLNKLRDKIHRNAIDKGWWDGDDWSLPEKLALIHSEVSEALEADRNNRHCDNEKIPIVERWHLETIRPLAHYSTHKIFKDIFEQHIKDTFEDELADVVIRCLDLCGKMKIEIPNNLKEAEVEGNVNAVWYHRNDIAISEKMCALHTVVSSCYNNIFMSGAGGCMIVDIIVATIAIAESLNIDLEKHITLKMRYNALREYKHGGKKY